MADTEPVTIGEPPSTASWSWMNEIAERVSLSMHHARNPLHPGGSTFAIIASDGLFEVNVKKVHR